MVAFPTPFKNSRQQIGVYLEAEAGQTLRGNHIIYKEVLKVV